MANRTFKVEKEQSIALYQGDARGRGNDAHLPIGRGNNIEEARGELKFGLNWSNVSKITRAWLHLTRTTVFHISFGGSPKIVVRRLTQSFGSGGGAEGLWDVTTENHPGKNSVAGVESDVLGTSQGGVSKIDITELLEAWAPAHVKKRNGQPGGGATNHGLLLKSFDEGSSTRSIEFYGLRAGGGNRPKIELIHEGNNLPLAPKNISPTHEDVGTGDLGQPYKTIEVTSPILWVHMELADDDLPEGSSPGATTDYITRADYQVYNETPTDASLDGSTTAIPLKAGSQGYTDKTHASVDVKIQLTEADMTKTRQWRGRLYDKAGDVGDWSPLQKIRLNRRPLTPVNVRADPNSRDPLVSGVHKDIDAGSLLAPAGSESVRIRWYYKDPLTLAETPMEDRTHATGSGTSFAVATSPGLGWNVQYRLFVQTRDQFGSWSPAENEPGAMTPIVFTPRLLLGPDNLSPRTVATKHLSRTPTFQVGHSVAWDQYELEAYADATEDLAPVGAAIFVGIANRPGGSGTAQIPVVYAGTPLSWSFETGRPSLWWRAKIHITDGSWSEWSELLPNYINALPNASPWYYQRLDGQEGLVSPYGSIVSEMVDPSFRLPFNDPDITSYGDWAIWRQHDIRFADDNALLARIVRRIHEAPEAFPLQRLLEFATWEGINGTIAGWGVGIVSSSIASPTVISVADGVRGHGLTTGNKVTIAGHTGSTATPAINGQHTVTVINATDFSLNGVNCTVAGTPFTGTVVGEQTVLTADTVELPDGTISGPTATSLKLALAGLPNGAAAVNRGPAAWLGTLYTDLSSALITRFWLDVRTTRVTGLAIKFRFTFSGSDANYAEYTVTPGQPNMWETRVMLKASPTATGGTVNWAQVSGFNVRVANSSGGAFAAATDVHLDNLQIDPLASFLALGTTYRVSGAYMDNNEEDAWGVASAFTLKASRIPRPTWAGRPSSTDPTPTLPIMYWGEVPMAAHRFLIYRRRGYGEVVGASPDMKSYWRFDEATGSFRNMGEGMGGLPNGTIARSQTGPLTAVEPSDKAIDLDGSTGYVNLQPQHAFPGLMPYSVTFWLRSDIVDATTRVILQKVVDAGGGVGLGWDIVQTSGNALTATRKYTHQAQVQGLGATNHWRMGEPASPAGLGYPDRVATMLPVSYWRMGEASGAVVDIGTTPHDGTVVGGVTRDVANTALSTDDDGAIDFNGSSGYITVGDFHDFTGLAPMSMAFWVRPDSLAATSYIASKYDNVATDGWYLQVATNGQINWSRHVTTADALTSAVGALVVGTMALVACVFDGTNMNLFVNGVKTTRTSSKSLGGNAQTFTIGRASWAAANYWNGVIDEAVVWDRALTDLEAQALYQPAVVDTLGAFPGIAYGTLTRAVTGPLGADNEGGIDLDGATAYLDLGDVGDFPGVLPFTVGIWVNPDTIVTSKRLISKGGADGWGILMLNNLGGLRFVRDEGASESDCDSGNVLTTGAWQHIVATYDSANMNLYRNGVPIAGPTASVLSMPGNAHTLKVGRQANAASNYFDGKVAETLLAPRALTAAEVATLYAVGLDATTTVTVGPTAAIVQGTTYHVAWTFDGADMNLYLDGLLAAGPVDVAGTMLPDAVANLILGRATSGTQFLGGLIDDLAIWEGRALTADEVLAHFEEASVVPIEQLVYDTGRVELDEVAESGTLVTLTAPPVLVDNATFRAELEVTDTDGLVATIGDV